MKRPFDDSRKRIAWAKRDFKQFKGRCRRFLKSNPHIAVTEMDDEGIYELHKIKLAKPLPEVLTHRVSGVLESLRAALDLAASSVATLAGGDSGNVHFPFSATEADFKSRLGSACKNFPKEIHALFASFKPYKGGDDALWALNELCNASKHRLIVPIGMSTGPLHVERMEVSGPFRIPYCGWDGDKDELIYAAVRPGTKIRYKVHVSFAVAFGEIEIMKGKPVEAKLDALIRKVSGIIAATKAECLKIGLL
ncbi:MAG TPA: hypothetical protein VNK82_09900 [Terriglobales bacterium]|nr:hypothetical protein [Terriglobales bacterium]